MAPQAWDGIPIEALSVTFKAEGLFTLTGSIRRFGDLHEAVFSLEIHDERIRELAEVAAVRYVRDAGRKGGFFRPPGNKDIEVTVPSGIGASLMSAYIAKDILGNHANGLYHILLSAANQELQPSVPVESSQ